MRIITLQKQTPKNVLFLLQNIKPNKEYFKAKVFAKQVYIFFAIYNQTEAFIIKTQSG